MTPKIGPKKLYLFRLSTTTIPLPAGQTLEMSSGCYLVETTDGKRILIDTGMAPEAARSSGPPTTNEKNVLEHLASLNLRPQDIDVLICTHFDVDHAGYHDHFASAELIVQREHYTLARNGHPRFAAARSHWDHPALRYRLVDGDFELLPGVTLLETSGHVPGHQSVLVRLPKTGPVLLAIDAVALQRAFSVDRKASPIDDNEQQLRASTKKLLDLVEREQIKSVIFHHDGLQWSSLRRSPEYYD
ncbi:MAG TPA: N-acyl homoserine lactonase family protein [Candidatus Saccharimonadales bacterium]|jgi:N-acyl homoserine lactone hydrolase|nr:N-acyl homoserine lactonase family protein [Candidatus Saccharimonadales bacterium]